MVDYESVISRETVIDIQNVQTEFDGHVIHQALNLSIYRGEILGLMGGSGSGKTTLLRTIMMLIKPTSGTIHLLGHPILKISRLESLLLKQRLGVLFQHGALFTSMTVLENVSFPLKEYTQMSPKLIEEIALYKLAMTNFPLNLVHLYPSELSGGMVKRAALARAIVQDAEILFLDEPTAGLDPESAAILDELILSLKKWLGLTIVVITHDRDTLWNVTDRVAFLGEKRVILVDTMEQLQLEKHPLVQSYFSVERSYRRFIK
jgi:phospholipid/cholesterol/gamma-HCH transport system ATP-binding protein